MASHKTSERFLHKPEQVTSEKIKAIIWKLQRTLWLDKISAYIVQVIPSTYSLSKVEPMKHILRRHITRIKKVLIFFCELKILTVLEVLQHQFWEKNEYAT